MNKQPFTCPIRAGTCEQYYACERRGLCVHATVAPLLKGIKPALHFVGFRDPQRYENAVQVFGLPDIIHHIWDQRAQREIAHGWDTVVFAQYHNLPPSSYNYDDSNQPDDPAAKERVR